MFEDWLFDPQTEGRFDDLRKQAQEVRAPAIPKLSSEQAKKKSEIDINPRQELLREGGEVCDVYSKKPETLSKHQTLLKTLSKP
jgi:hypothetical protein